MMKIFLLVGALLAVFSCKTLTTSECQRLNEQLNSENRLFNKKMMLILRQNSVYVEENLIYKRSLDQKTAQYEKLRGDMESQERKLQGDIALLEGRNLNLQEKNRILEAQSSEKLRELAELNKQVEKRLGDEIASLHAGIKKNAEEFGRQKEEMMLLAAQKDFEHSKQSEELKKSIAAREAEASDLKTKNAEFAMKLAETKKALDDAGASMRNLELDISKLRAGLAAAEKESRELRERLEKKPAAPGESGVPAEKKTAPGDGQKSK